MNTFNASIIVYNKSFTEDGVFDLITNKAAINDIVAHYDQNKVFLKVSMSSNKSLKEIMKSSKLLFRTPWKDFKISFKDWKEI